VCILHLKKHLLSYNNTFSIICFLFTDIYCKYRPKHNRRESTTKSHCGALSQAVPAHLGNNVVCEDGSVGMPDYITVARLGNDAVCEDGSVGMPDYITVARLGRMSYVRMEVLGCPII